MQTQARSQHTFGGVFSPLAQYPGSCYSTLLRRPRDVEELPVAPPTAPPHGEDRKNTALIHCVSTPHLPQTFTSALLLVDAESNAAVDRRLLRDVGIQQVRVLTSGMQTARLLAGLVTGEEDFHTDVLICHSRLADIRGAQLASLLRLNPHLQDLPMLAVVRSGGEGERLKALAAGFNSLLVRPYSQHNLNLTLHTLGHGITALHAHAERQHPNMEAFDAALQRYEKGLNEMSTPESAFKAGLQYLHSQQWDNAIQAFQRALHMVSIKGEAELGLAAAWRGKGDQRKYERYLEQACQSFARGMVWRKTRVAYVRLLELNKNAPSPFLAAAESLLRAGKVEDAAAALAAGHDLLPESDAVPRRLAQACLFTENPESCAHRLERALNATALGQQAEEMGGNIRKALAEHARQASERREAMERRQAALAAQDQELTTRTLSLDNATAGTNTVDGDATPVLPSFDDVPPLAHAPQTDKKRYAEKQRHTQKSRGSASAERGHSTASDSPSEALQPMQPMQEDEAGSRLFSAFPGLNEAITVAKVTWKLLKR